MKLFPVLSFVLLATSDSASAVVSVPLKGIQRSGSYLKGLAATDHGVRAASLKPHGPATVPATNFIYQGYTTSVGIGNPPTYYNLIIDTGSSNTFCGMGIPYHRTSTSIPTGQHVNVTYGSGGFSGYEYLDQVTLAPGLVITNQSIGDALQSTGFQGADGFVGLGPPDLTRGSLTNDTDATVPTVMNNLISQKIIEHQIVGVYFAPATSINDKSGVLTYGGVDPQLYKGEVTYVPVTTTSFSNYFWGINVTSSAYGTHAVIPNSTAGIVDTGTTQVLLADRFFDVYMKAIPGAKLDNVSGYIEIPPSSVSKMQPLNFTIGNRVFTMDVAAQLFPTYQNGGLGVVAGKQYGTVGNLANLGGPGLDFILGMAFMERYYTVFDADNNRVGFAQTNNTFTVYKG